jgi:hypothetical protein
MAGRQGGLGKARAQVASTPRGTQGGVRGRRQAAPGKSREEIKDRYVAELRARGQQVPPGPLLEAEIDALTGHPMRGLWKMWKTWPEPFPGF